MNLWVEARHDESPSCHVCCTSGGIIKVFNISHDLLNHVIEGSSNFMSGSSSCFANALPILVAVCIVVVDVFVLPRDQEDHIIKGSSDCNNRSLSR